MFGLAVLAFVLPMGRQFYDLHLPSALVLVEALAIGAGAAMALELADRVSARIRPAS